MDDRPAEPRGAWGAFWYTPEPAVNLAVARILLAGTALWIVLSRHDLPSIVAFAPELWSHVSWWTRLRFFLLWEVGVERMLFGVLHVTLAAALLGFWPRLACAVSGLLLYHFAPLESIVWSPNPYLRGLTIPALGLLILSFSRSAEALSLLPRGAPDAVAPSAEFRWPLRLVQVLMCQIYFFSGWAKLVTSGPAWLTAENIRGWLLLIDQSVVGEPSFGTVLAGYPLVCAAMAWAGMGLDLAFPLVLFFPGARWVLVPLAFVFHAASSMFFRIFFQNAGLLLLFVNWKAVLAVVESRRGTWWRPSLEPRLRRPRTPD